jgi:hypothetical protein
MRTFKLMEISAVDRPAQTHASALIMKRDSEEDGVAKGYSDLVDIFTSLDSGHKHGICVSKDYDNKVRISVKTASAKNGGEHDHQIMRGLDGSLIVSENQGHSHTLDAMSVQSALLTLMVSKESSGAATAEEPDAELVGKKQPDTEIDMAAEKDAGPSAEVTELQNQVDRLQKIVDLSLEHRAHYDGLTVSKQASFLDAEDGDRDALIEKSAKNDPVVFTSDDGTEYRKSAGDLLIKMAKERDEDRAELVKSRVEAQQARLEKRANEELGLLPGEVVAKIALLRGLDAIDAEDDVKKAAAKILVDANKIASLAFQTVGKSVPDTAMDTSSAQGEIDRRVAKAMTEDSLPRERALQKVLNSAEGRALYDAARAERIRTRQAV